MSSRRGEGWGRKQFTTSRNKLNYNTCVEHHGWNKLIFIFRARLGLQVIITVTLDVGLPLTYSIASNWKNYSTHIKSSFYSFIFLDYDYFSKNPKIILSK